MTTSIRPARLNDASDLTDLWTAAGLSLRAEEVPTELASVLARDPELVLVAENGERLVGAVFGAFDGRRGWVNRLAVRAGYRDRGIGRLLLTELETCLTAKGCRKVNLLVEHHNAAVTAFYTKLGYTGSELIFMSKRLPAPRHAAPPAASPAAPGPAPQARPTSLDLRPSCDGVRYVFVTGAAVPPGVEPVASVTEPEGATLVIRQAEADGYGLGYLFVAARITLGAQTALDCVGVTAAFSTALTSRGIACNVIAGFHHDHLFVPYAEAAAALAVLTELRPG